MLKKRGVLILCGALFALPAFVKAQEVRSPITTCTAPTYPNEPGRDNLSVEPSVIQSATKATLSIETPADSDQQQGDNDTQQLGSGVVISPDGLFLTNAHVVGQSTRFRVRLHDGTIKQASLVGLDRLVDIALARIEIEPRQTEPFAYLHLKLSHNPQIGEPVIALGYPLNFGLSATRGIVSGLGRAYDGVWPVDFLQHDAALNPGNSGGPLIDAQGCLIGLNTATPVETQFDIGVGLAIPADLIGEIVPQLLTTGAFPRGHLGIYVSQLDQTMSRALGAIARGGLIIDDIDAGSTGALAGLAPGDLITHLDGRPIRQVRDLTQYLLRRRQGEAVTMTTVRATHIRIVRVSLGSPPINASQKLVFAKATDLSTAPFDHRLGFEIVAGVTQAQIASIVADGIADLAGLQVGDMILALNGTPVTSAEQAQALISRLSEAQGESAIIVRVGRTDMRARHITLRLMRSQSQANLNLTSQTSRQSLPYGPL